MEASKMADIDVMPFPLHIIILLFLYPEKAFANKKALSKLSVLGPL